MSRGMLLAVAMSVLLVVPAAPAVADPGFDVPDDAVITIEGDGSGHGIGMSQYGAYRAAGFEGETSREILRTYYPGTRLGRSAGSVAVLITADDDHDLRVAAVRGMRVRAGGKTWRPRVARAREWRVVPQARRNVISYRTGSWHVWRKVRGDVSLSAGRKALTLRTPDGRVRYRGTLRTTRHLGERVTVNALPMEQYVRGVVPAEMQAGWPQHALRAQAVAVRTYAAFERADHRSRAYHLCDTASCQAYGGASAEAPSSTDATRATAKQVLTWRGDLAFAQYSASNGGWTVGGGRPYLVAQDDPYEGGAGEGTSSDYYGWRRTFTTSQFEEAFGLGNLTYLAIEGRDGRGRRGGRVTDVRVRTEAGFDETRSGEHVRSHLGLPSTLFEITSVG